jgi:hypothetical protein
MAAAEGTSQPVLVIASGSPSAEDIAAVVAVLAALPPPLPGVAQDGVRRSEWSARYRMMRAPLLRGPGAWRASALPR